MPTVTRSLEERFWKYVTKDGANGCWRWHAVKDSNGYGRISRNFGPKKNWPVLPHRVSLEIHGVHVPDDVCVLHKCDNPECTNPDHLFLGDRKANVDDMIAKGRIPRGEKRGHAKLTPDDVVFIRFCHSQGVTQTELAKLFGVCQMLISGIVKYKRWKHV